MGKLFEDSPSQEEKRQNIAGYTQNNKKIDLTDSDYDRIDDILRSNKKKIGEVLKGLHVSPEDWNLDERLDSIRKKALFDLIKSMYDDQEYSQNLDYYLNRIKELLNFTNFSLDRQGEFRQALVEWYKYLVRKGDIDSLAKLQKVTKMEPDWQGELKKDVVEGYKNLIRNGYTNSLAKLQEITKVEPDWQGKLKQVVVEGYKNLVRNSDINDLYDLNKLHKLQEVTKVEPDWQGELKEAVVEGYKYLVRSGSIYDLAELQEITKVEADWQGELKEAVVEGYKNLIRNCYIYLLNELQKVTKVEADWQGEFKQAVMEGYKYLVRSGNTNSLAELQEKTGVEPPDWQGELKKDVVEGYKYLVIRGDSLAELQEKTGVEPPDWQGELKQAVMERYKYLVRKGDTNSLAELQEKTGVEPPDWQGELKEDVMEGYKYLVRSGNTNSLAKLQEKTGVEPDWQGELKHDLYKMYCMLCSNNDNASIKKAEEITGLKMGEVIKLETFWKEVVEYSDVKTLEFLENNYGDQQTEWLDVFKLVLRENYNELLEKALSNSTKYNFVMSCITRYKIKPDKDLVSSMILNINTDKAFDRFLQLVFLCGYRELEKIKAEQIKGKKLTMRQIAIISLLDLIPNDDNEEEKSKFMDALNQSNSHTPIAFSLLKARNMPSPSRRIEYCPWNNELEPLISNLQNKFDLKDNESASALIDYIQRFGMKNLPLLATVSMNLYLLRNELVRNKDNTESVYEKIDRFINSEAGICLRQYIDTHGMGIDLKSVNKPEDIDRIFAKLLREIDKLKESITTDALPDVLEQSSMDMELFNSIMVKSGSWGKSDHGYTRESLIAKWRKYKENNPTEMPAYYRQRTYSLKSTSEKSLTEELDSFNSSSEESSKVIKLKNKKREQILQLLQRKEYKDYLSPYYVAFDEAERLGESVTDPKIVFFTVIKLEEDKLKKQKEQFEAISDNPKNAKKKNGMRVSIQKQEALLQSLKRLETIEGIKEIINEAIRKKEQEIIEIDKNKKQAITDLPVFEEELKKINESMEDDNTNSKKEKERQRIVKEIQRSKSRLSFSTEDLQKDTERLRILRDKFDQGLQSREKEYLFLQAMVTCIAHAFDKKTSKSIFNDSLRLIVARMVTLESEAHVRTIREAHKEANDGKEHLAWRTLFQEQLVQHSMDPDYADHPRVVPFSKESIDLLTSIWRLNNIRQKSMEVLSGTSKDGIDHPFLKTVMDIRRIEAEIEALDTQGMEGLSEKVEVTYSPCHGLGRIFAGDVGDACYTSHRHNFADGEYPNLHSLILSQKDKKTEDIKMLGSILLIEGRNIKGKRYLFARAVNPIDTVLKRQIKAEEFLRGLLEYLKTTAEEAGFDEALLCIDTGPSNSGSNRHEMFEAMEKSVLDNKWPIADELEKTPETKFKYNVWDTKNRKVYRIWQK